MPFPLHGRVKRDFFAQQLRIFRRSCGRGRPARHFRPTGRTMTREHAWLLWCANRAFGAASRRADRKWDRDHDRRGVLGIRPELELVIGPNGRAVEMARDVQKERA